MKIDVPNAAIGLLRIAGIDVTYDGQNRFTGTAKIKLPPAYSGGIAKTSVTFGFEDGDLSLVEVAPPPFTPTLPIVGSPPTPIVGLDRLTLSYIRKPSSRLFQGTLFMIAGPKLFDFQVADLKGTLGIEFGQPGLRRQLEGHTLLRLAQGLRRPRQRPLQRRRQRRDRDVDRGRGVDLVQGVWRLRARAGAAPRRRDQLELGGRLPRIRLR
jgi:hypothetical protein